MEALGGLAVAERDILARATAQLRTRSNRARSGDSGRFAPREPASPFSPPGIYLWSLLPNVQR